MIEVTKQSTLTGKTNTMTLKTTQEKYDAWVLGNVDELIQEYFTELNDDEREFILTGATPEEWDDLFDESREEETE